VEQYENIYDKIQELLGRIPGNVYIQEEQIDADVQLEYYDYAQKLKERVNRDEVLRKKDTIFHTDLPVEDKKYMMVRLASIDNIEAYRTLEKYTSIKNAQLKDWAKLALQECKLLLECKLLDQNQVLISTGLGGKGLNLRYFTVFVGVTGKSFTRFQKKILKNEIGFAVRKAGGILEKIMFDRELCTILSMIHIQIPIQQLFDELIAECNQYGDFIFKDYIITNVKIISNRDIRIILGNSRENKTRKK
jgi:hypothetical protein